MSNKPHNKIAKEMREPQEVEIIVVPFPDGQGHINPILQFSKTLAIKGLKVTVLHVLSTHEIPNNEKHKEIAIEESLKIDVEYRPRVAYKGGEPESEPIDSYMQRIKSSICFHLENLINQRKNSSKVLIGCVVYDSLISWVLDVANGFGILGASFFTESCAVNAIFYNVYCGRLKMGDDMAMGITTSVPALPVLEFKDFPSFVQNLEQYPVFLNSMINQFSNRPRWMFINSFHALEPQVLEWMQRDIPLKTVGPMVPSVLIGKKKGKKKGLKNDQNYGMDLIKSTEEEKIIKWLDSKDENSVVYVSFGSVSKLEEEQMKELAWGLKSANITFLWVIKEQEAQNKLPKAFFEETKEMGMVVKWCSQVQVLAHKSIGCFVTHCGWNSVLEALICGVPMVAMPQWTDQMTNAKFVEDVWNVGFRVCPKENGIIVGREEIEFCIREVMEGHKSVEIRQNARKWMKFAAEDQISDNNIDDFVAQITNCNI